MLRCRRRDARIEGDTCRCDLGGNDIRETIMRKKYPAWVSVLFAASLLCIALYAIVSALG